MSQFKIRKRFRGAPRPKAKVRIGSFEKLQGPVGNQKWNSSSAPVVEVTIDSPYRMIEMCQDQTNPGPPFRTGGPFAKLVVNLFDTDVWTPDPPHQTLTTISDSEGTSFRRYVGAVAPLWDLDPDASKYVSDDAIRTLVLTSGSGYIPNIDSWSCKVDKALRPKLEKASLGVAIAELRDLPHMLHQTSKGFHEAWQALGGHKTNPLQIPKKVSEDFLNFQFGWFPFIKDVNDMLDVTFFGQQYIDDLSARNNVWDHRAATLAQTEEDVLLSSGSGWHVYPANSFLIQTACTNFPGSSSNGRYSLRRRTSTKTWATGDYKFYQPEFDRSLLDNGTSWHQLKRYLILYGIRLNPSVLYKATPWSWLVDWFSNVGDVVDGVTAAAEDGVVSKNLFTMQHRTIDLVLQQEINWADGARTYEFHRPQVCKQRVTTDNPFGFCLSANLTGRQLAILAALGLTKRSLVSTH